MDYKSSHFSGQIKFGLPIKLYALIKFYKQKNQIFDKKFYHTENIKIKFLSTL